MHRPRTDAGAGNGQRHKKRVRTPHNTREKQRQIALGHGETLMPNNVIYRTPNSVMSSEDSAYNSMGGHYDTRPPRPDSIELRRSYPHEAVDGHGYVPVSTHYQSGYSQQIYEESIYNSQNLYGAPNGQGPMSPESMYAPGTPSRGKPRPSQPPPAPPSGNTPTASNANTPTRNRSMSNRDVLPPPPPVPMEVMASPPTQQMHHTNGTSAVAAKLLARSHSTSRSGSPQLNHNMQDQNALVMAQLNNQINNLNNLNIQMTQQMNDLPPPPPIPEQVHIHRHPNHGINETSSFSINSLQLSPKHGMGTVTTTMKGSIVTFPEKINESTKAVPPPPPPPPPIIDQSPSSTLYKPMSNGDVKNGPAGGNLITPAKLTKAKKVLPTVDDTRNDLLKAIRDGKQHICL